MFDIPERSLQPPEPVVLGVCPICGEYVQAGDTVWEVNGKFACIDHMDVFAAEHFGCRRMIAEA